MTFSKSVKNKTKKIQREREGDREGEWEREGDREGERGRQRGGEWESEREGGRESERACVSIVALNSQLTPFEFLRLCLSEYNDHNSPTQSVYYCRPGYLSIQMQNVLARGRRGVMA